MRNVLPVALVTMLCSPAAASAFFAHTVLPGESLYSIAAADGLSVAQLAAANGLSTGSQLILGSTVQIPPVSSSVAPVASSAGTMVGDGDNDADDVGLTSSSATVSSSSGGSYVVQPGDTLSAIAARAGVSLAALAAANGLDPNGTLISGSTLRLSGSSSGTTRFVSTSSGGSYVVQPGDTLTAIAARAGLSLRSLAAANGLDPNGVLLTGSTLRLSGVSSASSLATASADTQPVGAAAQGDPTAPPFPTPERLSASEIGNVAATHGVSPSLADAIAWQESGFNNDLVSSADARGIMQILPGTWDWIQHTLVAGESPLAPASAVDNVRGGVLLLRSLLNSTGGNPALAAAGYYQGLPSVQRNGLFPSTQQYVQSVMALRQRFGGG